jgi:hypothetical protein
MKIWLMLTVCMAVFLAACSTSVEVTVPGGDADHGDAMVKDVMEKKGDAMEKPAVTNDVAAMLAAGTDSQCTFTGSDGESVTLWIHGDSFKSLTAGQEGLPSAYGLSAGGQFYTWFDGKDFGLKMALNAPGAITGAALAEGSTGVSCEAASLSESDFAVPSGVDFVDNEADFEARMLADFFG